jgi:energy-converting hydrogenase Eha subunit F
MFTTFITVLAWIYSVAYFGWVGLMLTIALTTRGLKIKLHGTPMLIGFASLAWIVTTFIS